MLTYSLKADTKPIFDEKTFERTGFVTTIFVTVTNEPNSITNCLEEIKSLLDSKLCKASEKSVTSPPALELELAYSSR
jgi:hypothetical protein